MTLSTGEGQEWWGLPGGCQHPHASAQRQPLAAAPALPLNGSEERRRSQQSLELFPMQVSCKVLGLQGLLRCSAVGSIVMGLQQAERALWGRGTGSARAE